MSSYQIIDGVRRAKAAEMLGHVTIRAELENASGQLNSCGDVSVSSLTSPKSPIEVNTPRLVQRWLRVLNGTRAGDHLPPIRVQPSTSGTPLPLVEFTF